MLDCWKDSPHSRPSFAKLEKEFGSLLEMSDRCRYVEQCREFDSNIAKLRGSLVRTSEVENRDYLAMMSPPSYRFDSPSFFFYKRTLGLKILLKTAVAKVCNDTISDNIYSLSNDPVESNEGEC